MRKVVAGFVLCTHDASEALHVGLEFWREAGFSLQNLRMAQESMNIYIIVLVILLHLLLP